MPRHPLFLAFPSAAHRSPFALVLLVVAIACGGGTPSGPSQPLGGPNTISARIDGESWTARIADRFYIPRTGELSFFGSALAPRYGITISLVGLHGTGTYPLKLAGPTDGESYAVVQGTPGGQIAWWRSSSGLVTITEFTGTSAKGTFTFTGAADPQTPATGTKVVTDGVFEVAW